MYRIDRNNFFKNEKKATVYTPKKMSDFLFSIVDGKIDKERKVFDPCVGKGSLLIPFKNAGYEVLGVDIEDQGFNPTQVKNYFEIKKDEIKDLH